MSSDASAVPVVFDHRKCIRCGLCLGECLGNILRTDTDGFPEMTQKSARHCIGCGHCFAVCPAGAVTFHGHPADDALPFGEKPTGGMMTELLRQRRSCRKYQQDPIAPEKMARLKEILRYSPTGCNDHRLVFSIVEDRETMDELRARVSKRLTTLSKTGILGMVFPPSKRYFKPIRDGVDVIFRGAPHLIAVSVPVFSPCSTWDAKIALAYFDTLAQSMGLGTCWCGFGVWMFRLMPSLRRKLHLPHFYRLDAMMLFGEPALQYQRTTIPDPVRIDRIST